VFAMLCFRETLELSLGLNWEGSHNILARLFSTNSVFPFGNIMIMGVFGDYNNIMRAFLVVYVFPCGFELFCLVLGAALPLFVCRMNVME